MKEIAAERVKIIGREHIKLTEEFFKLPYVQSYMQKHGLN